MELNITSRFKNGWNAFKNKDPTISSNHSFQYYGSMNSYQPHRYRLTSGKERSIITSIFNRIALDVSSITIQHCRVDDNGCFKEPCNTYLNDCLTLEANIDQTSRAFIQDVVMSMLDEGCVAIVPVDTVTYPNKPGFDIGSMRTGEILEWYPDKVRVRVYNDQIGKKEELILSKKTVAIVENPLYSVINEPNSTVQRLIRKLSLLDATDEQTASGKLDLIIQLPYIIKTELRRKQAEQRRDDIERQLAVNKYGIAYADGSERITQLNRPVENNLLKHVEYLTDMVFSQLGMTMGILNGTADEKTMLNYYRRVVEPIISAIVDAMRRTFITKTARTQNKTIAFFIDPFKLVPINDIAEIADKFTRNEILSSNEVRQIIGRKPSDDPKADRLINSNNTKPKDIPSSANDNIINKEEIQNE